MKPFVVGYGQVATCPPRVVQKENQFPKGLLKKKNIINHILVTERHRSETCARKQKRLPTFRKLATFKLKAHVSKLIAHGLRLIAYSF
jgi:predicted metal-binding protein